MTSPSLAFSLGLVVGVRDNLGYLRRRTIGWFLLRLMFPVHQFMQSNRVLPNALRDGSSSSRERACDY
jgi:hypothetical protein